MRKYILAMIIGITVILGMMQLHQNNRIYNSYRFHFHHGKLLKETTIWLYDSDCYKQSGIYKRVYRKYSYHYLDSTFKYDQPRDMLSRRFAITYRGDTVFIEYTDLTNYPRREE